MPMPRSYFFKRVTLGSALLGLLALTTGCEEAPTNPEAAPDAAKAQNKSMMDAMSKNYGPGGAATSKKAAEK